MNSGTDVTDDKHHHDQYLLRGPKGQLYCDCCKQFMKVIPVAPIDIVEKKEWYKLPWGELYKSIDTPVAVIANERGLILAEVFSEEQADRIIADHTTAALVPELQATIKRQMVWSTAGLHGKAEDDRINADKLMAINAMVNGLEEQAALVPRLLAALRAVNEYNYLFRNVYGEPSDVLNLVLAAIAQAEAAQQGETA